MLPHADDAQLTLHFTFGLVDFAIAAENCCFPSGTTRAEVGDTNNRLKFTSTAISTATGFPSLTAGSNTHLLTASTVFSSKPNPDPLSILTLHTLPSVRMIKPNTLVPSV